MGSVLELAPYLGWIAGLGVVLFLFLETRRQQEDFQVRWNKRQQMMQAEVGKLRSLTTDLAARLEDAERRSATLAAPAQPPSGLNLNRRSQAIRMFRRGERPEQIAAALAIPLAEVQLLLKVHRILTAEIVPAG